jgi:hypothetical protein
MPPEVVTRAFEPFFTTKPPRPRNWTGPRERLRLRQAVRRQRHHLQRAWPRHHRQPLPAGY